uniref:Uncharacterized protein n=1 Tax=Arundo donax TaxID=35708 RepID=A0A0A9CKS4_ARUDO
MNRYIILEVYIKCPIFLRAIYIGHFIAPQKLWLYNLNSLVWIHVPIFGVSGEI